ncbi:hypothetical protein [Gordonia sp. SL306]|uniref:hypothetical protein n=1 Tax=Gordonia sp. SL306 TaxID=2995145 RepID=UPI002D1E384B|nr:hypothetical protein [Gordonia sp. SL306]
MNSSDPSSSTTFVAVTFPAWPRSSEKVFPHPFALVGVEVLAQFMSETGAAVAIVGNARLAAPKAAPTTIPRMTLRRILFIASSSLFGR